MPSSVFTRRARLRRGFSILELITALVIIGVLASVSAGKVRDVMTQQRLYRASNNVQTNVEAAWALAARNRQPIRIVWDLTNLQMKITDRAGTKTFRRAAFGQDPYGLTAGSIAFSTPMVEVFPDGLATSSLLVTFTKFGVTKRIAVSRAGLVQQQ